MSNALAQKTVDRWRWIVALAFGGWCLLASWGLILLFQLSRHRDLDPPTSQGSLLAIAASAVALAAVVPAIAARVVRRSAFFWLSALAAAATALFILVLALTT